MSGGTRRNWVDRGDAPDAVLARVLGHYLALPFDPPDPRVAEAATIVVGMVARADPTKDHESYAECMQAAGIQIGKLR